MCKARAVILPIALIFLLVIVCHVRRQRDREACLAVIGSISSLTIYDIEAWDGMGLDAEILKGIPHVRLSEDETKGVFRNVEYVNDLFLWKGSFLGIADSDRGTQTRLAISYYGSYFRCSGFSGGIELRKESREFYEKLIENILSDLFVPLRRERGGRGVDLLWQQ